MSLWIVIINSLPEAVVIQHHLRILEHISPSHKPMLIVPSLLVCNLCILYHWQLLSRCRIRSPKQQSFLYTRAIWSNEAAIQLFWPFLHTHFVVTEAFIIPERLKVLGNLDFLLSISSSSSVLSLLEESASEDLLAFATSSLSLLLELLNNVSEPLLAFSS